MVTVPEVEKAIQSGLIAHFEYKGEVRVVNPVEMLDSTNKVLVGQEAGKGWRRYSLDKMGKISLHNS